MKSIIKCGLIGGVLLGIGYRVFSIESVFALHIVIIPGAMMFAINDFLQKEQNQQSYTNMKGVSLGFLTGVLCLAVGVFIVSTLTGGPLFDGVVSSKIKLTIKASLPLLIGASILVPFMYLTKSSKLSKSTDILDEEI